MTFDIEGLPPSISNSVTVDIDYLRYRHTISKVKNVDVEWAFDIEVFDIKCCARYRRSDTRYREFGMARIQMSRRSTLNGVGP
jgi:hypothetical protein